MIIIILLISKLKMGKFNEFHITKYSTPIIIINMLTHNIKRKGTSDN